ncbi:MAG: methyltransferase domain-containing protein [Chitinophagales bacterium]|nr:methyltransferase domain-containing protein [Chitinophagaceae bacterium]MCB9064941.1 methyltransferase domain-containing protein [Chitinophagales bacterium]
MNNPIYDTIGINYNTTRKADPVIADILYNLLQPKNNGKYLDIGCGTGNYLKALSDKGLDIIGVDPSDTMLKEAKEKNPNTTLIQGKAENLPFDDANFDGGMGIFTLHHWNDIQQGINEIYRVLKPGGQFVFFSFTAKQMYGYWLHHYFPEMIRISGEAIPSEEEMFTIFNNAGFSNIATENYFIHKGLTDLFLYANKHTPEAYLDPEVRKGASSFRIYCIEEEVEQGLIDLEKDIETGEIDEVMKKYGNDMGDYIFYIVEK